MSKLQDALPGYSHVSRYFSEIENAVIVRLQLGELYVTRNDELIRTTLGSCVAACIRDPQAGIGGVNHFLLPRDTSAKPNAEASRAKAVLYRYGEHSMTALIDALVHFGAARHRLEIKVFGGSVLNFKKSENSAGEQNIKFLLNYLEKNNLDIAARDLGGDYSRLIEYAPLTGTVRMRRYRQEKSGD